MDVEISVDEVVDELHKKFSFHQIHKESSEHQPKFPQTEWIQRAFERLVKAGEAEWINRGKGKLKAKFTRYDDVLEHFVDLCASDQDPEDQPSLNLQM